MKLYVFLSIIISFSSGLSKVLNKGFFPIS